MCATRPVRQLLYCCIQWYVHTCKAYLCLVFVHKFYHIPLLLTKHREGFAQCSCLTLSNRVCIVLIEVKSFAVVPSEALLEAVCLPSKKAPICEEKSVSSRPKTRPSKLLRCVGKKNSQKYQEAHVMILELCALVLRENKGVLKMTFNCPLKLWEIEIST